MPLSRKGFATPALVATLLAIASAGAQGATYVITTLADDVAANGNCTLREALLASASNTTQDQCVGDGGADEIVLDAIGTYPFSAGTVVLSAVAVTVRGDSDHPRSSYLIDMADQNRFFVALNGSNIRLERLELTRGYGDTGFFGSNSRGGAVDAHDSDLVLRDVRISNSRSINGGALGFRADIPAVLDLEAVELAGNQANYIDPTSQRSGGGLALETNANATLRFVDVRFVGNAIVSGDPSVSGFGGGAYFRVTANSSVEARHLEFTGNTIATAGGAVGGGFFGDFAGTGGFVLEDVVLTGNDFTGPATIIGGSAFDLYLGGTASPTIRRVRATGNGAGDGTFQALIRVQDPAEALISDVLVADGDGGGLYLDVQCLVCSSIAGNLTVTGHPGSGLMLGENTGTLRLENSIVWNNATVSGANLDIWLGTPEVSAENLVGVDPLFANAPAGDYRPGPASPAIDAGDATFAAIGPWDAGHGDRVIGADVDLGALERGALFADDFEHGDAYAWSAILP